MDYYDLYVCHPVTAECRYLADLPATTSNGMTFVPPGTVFPDRDALIAVGGDGSWNLMERVGQTIVSTWLGEYGYTSSGDAYSISGVGTWATVLGGLATDSILSVDPLTGSPVGGLAAAPTASVWGLAGWDEEMFLFSAWGTVHARSIYGGADTLIDDSGYSWWGAGVQTVLPPPQTTTTTGP